MFVVEVYVRKFGGFERAAQIIDNVIGVVAMVGFEFYMERVVWVNMLVVYCLFGLVEREYGAVIQNILKERLLQVYFVDGCNVGDHDTLVELVIEVGMVEDWARMMLDDGEGIVEIRAEIVYVNDFDIIVVFIFVFDGCWVIFGVQDFELFLWVFQCIDELHVQEVAEMGAGVEVGVGDAVCTDEVCEI